jgi:hypothetical protein
VFPLSDAVAETVIDPFDALLYGDRGPIGPEWVDPAEGIA